MEKQETIKKNARELSELVAALLVSYTQDVFKNAGRPITERQAEDIIANIGLTFSIRRLNEEANESI